MAAHEAPSSTADERFDAALQRLSALDTSNTRELFGRVVDVLADDREQATSLLSGLLDLQAQDESAINYGQFPMRLGRGRGDLNSCLFLMPTMVELLSRHADALPPELRQRLDAAARRALVAAQRRWDEEIFDIHRDHKGYTNIFLLYTQALLVGGQYYEDQRVQRMAAAQWQRWFNHVAYYGIDEFVSRAYSDVDYEALRRMHDRAADERMRGQIKLVLDYLVTLQHAVTHPRLKVQVCGSARDYRRSLGAGAHEPACVGRDGAKEPGTYEPPAAVVEAYRNRRFPYHVRGRATGVPFFYESWQSPEATLGSMTGGQYFWQQIHCIAAVGRSENERDLLLLPGSYTIANGYVHQQQHRALCVFARRPNTLLRTQRFTADTDLPGAFGDIGLGATDGWQQRTDGGRLIFTAHGHAVTVDPFVLADKHVRPAALETVRRDNLRQGGRFHDTPIDMQEYVFPADAEWCGCLVQVTAQDQLPPPVRLSCERGERALRVREAEGLDLHLFLQPAGEVTQLYEWDWRTTPLLACPERTLWPGELAARVVNGAIDG
ncbi:MAG: hypothetical protein ACODAQ_09285 [Phycisphaeraceae bacterium]